LFFDRAGDFSGGVLAYLYVLYELVEPAIHASGPVP
jgi:hypothetical protein